MIGVEEQIFGFTVFQVFTLSLVSVFYFPLKNHPSVHQRNELLNIVCWGMIET